MEQLRPTATTDEVLAEIGQRLQRYRLQQNRTVADLAADAGISQRTASRAEAGENPTLATVVRILRALDAWMRSTRSSRPRWYPRSSWWR